MRAVPFFLVSVVFLLTACGGDANQGITCGQLTARLAECYPDLASGAGARCTPETLSRYTPETFAGMTCGEIESSGKADVFAFPGGCPADEYVCGYIFCCARDFPVTYQLTGAADEWDFVTLVDDYQAQIPPMELAILTSATRAELLDVVSVTFDQSIDDGLDHGIHGAGPQTLAVEVTTGLMTMDFDAFQARLPPADWGVHLDHYLGGEAIPLEWDAVTGAPTRQLERMVFANLPCDTPNPLANNDMTKLEIIQYSADEAKVYWRVMYSDNGSTVSDVGTLTFARAGSDTQVTWHSAHRLGTPLETVVPSGLTQIGIGRFFPDQIRFQRMYALGL